MKTTTKKGAERQGKVEKMEQQWTGVVAWLAALQP